jgi:methionine synthase II (cobalamin-independent)
MFDEAVRDTIARFEATDSAVITDGEQRKYHNFAIDPRVETPEEIRDRTLEAARYIPVAQLGTTDDCGFSPFSDEADRVSKARKRASGDRFVDLFLALTPGRKIF